MPTNTPKRPVTEQITLDKAMELLKLHKTGGSQSKTPVITVVRDPNNLAHIISIFLHEAA